MKRLFFVALLFCNATFVFAQQYDESKVPAYTLPDPLLTLSGQAVKDARTWENARRPEVLRLFEDNIYGQMPRDFDSIRFITTREDARAMGGKALLKETRIDVYRGGQSVSIHLTLFVPGKASRPVPVFLLINNRGKNNTDADRKTKSPFWPAEMVTDSGYAIAAFHVSDLAPDDASAYASGLLRLYPEQLRAPNGMKAIGAWAWGASRVMDYFMKEKLVDTKKVVLVGHSRGGKTSLWAAAQDQRFAICVTNCSGNTGAALARRQFGERIKRINTSFPHWFSDNYKKYNDRENDLPVDQHMLIALIAPRPVYATNATKDLWADPTGTFLSLKNAEKVFALYGLRSALPAAPPPVNQAVENSILGYHNREGVHDMTEFDWRHFIRFARIHFAKK
ncbi:prolyl oligopeptidase family serine peptidase [Chitinophaga sp. GCM10012297]|uniref:Prolyl oligopeptidase family serine peptidase n=1 Tax=Chitinophaga chungangae TaxID=2821488 RepID=A0ABS3YJ85_9BACT|nr:prolyl oligopeptidase family serine peptidase [Chitinophaga chungangae]MBO9154757.1 prolyl oligopeptidase family serine peptidase [Chitinophaga chungangae]